MLEAEELLAGHEARLAHKASETELVVGEPDAPVDGEVTVADRALASAARVAAGLTLAREKAKPAKVVLKVRPANRGRASGWSMTCPEHGPMPVLAPSKAAGIEAAREHLELDHRNVGTIDAVDGRAGTKKKKRRRRG